MENQNQVAVHQNTAPVQFNFFDSNQFAVMQRVCKMFSSSELVPKMYQTSEVGAEKATANCMIAVETAQRIGASPLMVMQNMYIVYGQPAWSAKFLTATVNGCGRYNSIKYKWENLGTVKFAGKDIENWSCVAYTTEKGSDELLESIPVTIDMAIKEGWYGKKGSKWQTMPRLMLQYRTVTFWTRTYAPELSMGIKAEDEIRDIQDVSFEEVPPEEKKENKANKKEITIPEDGSKKQEEKPKLTKMKFSSMADAKKFLIVDCGVTPEVLTDDNTVKEIAKEHEVEIIMTGGPGF